MKGYIYKATHKDGLIYIGQSQSKLETKIKNFAHYKTPMGVLFRKDGKEAFSFSILAESSSKKKLNILEKQFIKDLNSTSPLIGLNCHKGGGAGEVKKHGKAVGFRLDPHIYNNLKKLAIMNHRSMTRMVEYLIEKELGN